MPDHDILQRLNALQTRYINALDRRDMTAWVACFDADASYICIAAENVEQDLPLALMMDDSLARIHDRANYITQVWAGTFEDYQTRHFIQPLSFRQTGPGLAEAESNFMVAYTQEGGKSGVLAAGIYQDVVSMEDGQPKFRSRRAVLDTVATPRYLVYPI
ncbi:aromatic-ring-hydroxylating dioxygenase subunit beta [Pigmentiphaga sp. CHJ604]|uniref:aromatic-ring-hydroxylating dioxygenase subunit beta n=1 Tax=Pigmentiphaga sp. CHJ604 TaxID=3081984 RepID=UPI0030D36FE4